MEPIFVELIPGFLSVPAESRNTSGLFCYWSVTEREREREREREGERDVSSLLNNITMSVHRLYSMFMMVGCVQEESMP